MFRSLKIALLATLALIVLVAAPVSAHEGVFSFKYIDGNYVIIAHQNVHDARSGIPITYNLRLHDLNGQPVEFSRVTAQLKLGNKTVLDKHLPMSDNLDAVFQHNYVRDGEYTLYVHFANEDQSLSKAEFPLIVAKGLEGPSLVETVLSAPTLIAFGLGVGVAVLFPRFLRSKYVREFQHRNKAN